MKVLVLRQGVHAMPASDYAAELRERLPDHEVVHAQTPGEERAEIGDADVVTGWNVSTGLLAEAEPIRLFACMFAGTDHLPMDALEERGVAVTNAAGVHRPNVAEHVLAYVLAFSRDVPEAVRRADRTEWRPFDVGELKGSTVTVVGLGAIGEGVVERLEPFGVETIGIRNDPSKGGPADEVWSPDRLHDALARSAYVVLACPLTEETRGLVSEEEFRTMPDDAVVVNVARGPVVDTDDLVFALQRRWVGGAALDVTDPEPLPHDHPLWDFGNVLVTPHNAGATPRYFERLADIVAGNVERLASADAPDLMNQVI
jgi:phosphoglycerate dehydrogenase-like enzyme